MPWIPHLAADIFFCPFLPKSVDVKLQDSSWVFLVFSGLSETQGSGRVRKLEAFSVFSLMERTSSTSGTFKKVPQLRGRKVENRALKLNTAMLEKSASKGFPQGPALCSEPLTQGLKGSSDVQHEHGITAGQASVQGWRRHAPLCSTGREPAR